jgi:hypothetical protein
MAAEGDCVVRTRNWRLAIVGLVMIVGAAAFFLFMGTMATQSTDPVELMRTVGQVSGAVGGIGLFVIVMGLIGRRSRANR